MCIKAAKHAGWLPLLIRKSPKASYTGFQIFNTKLKHEELSSLLDKAKSSCEAAVVELGYTGEQVSNCALKYTILEIIDLMFTHSILKRCLMQRYLTNALQLLVIYASVYCVSR